MRVSWTILGFVACFTVAGCGGGSDGGGGDPTKFVGAWTATSGGVDYNCGGDTSTSYINGTFSWRYGPSGIDLEYSGFLTNCTLQANVHGNTASLAHSPFHCPTSDASTGTVIDYMYSINSYTFTLSADGQTAQEKYSGTVVISDPMFGTQTCTLSESAAYSH